ncbi:MAG: PadR family transcriptional regulator [Candidatus Binataceae bacterium]
MSLGYAILSLLESSDASGYELMKGFDQSVAAFWHATHPQIYRELARLEWQHLVSHRIVIQQGRPNKKVFTITKAGEAELLRWLDEPETPQPQVNDLTTLKAFSLTRLPPERALAKVRELASIHRPLYETYRAQEREIRTHAGSEYTPDLGYYLTLLRGLTYEEGYLKWCEQVESAIKRAAGSTNSAATKRPRVRSRRGAARAK